MKIRQRGLPAGLFLSAVAFAATATVDPKLYLDDIKFLASPELRGRVTGSAELEKAAAFIERDYRQFGIKPVPGSAGYLQPLQVTTDAALGKANHFKFSENGRSITLHFPNDFVPFNFSQTGKLTGPVVFAGYGITATGKTKYDDYAGLDVEGKVVVLLRGAPLGANNQVAPELWQFAPFVRKLENGANCHSSGATWLLAPSGAPRSSTTTLPSTSSPA